MKEEVLMIPIQNIRILNPRHRDKKKFEVIVQSIKNLGLKKPIQVSVRSAHEGNDKGFDLVCGQGRLEAFVVLGYAEIPAIVVEVSKEERLLRSLIENIARRYSAPLDLLQEIQRLKENGYNNGEIGKKLDISDSMISGLLALQKAGEERLLEAALTGKVPLSVAIEIATADSVETQRALLKAYEAKQLTRVSIRTVKGLMDQRRLLGKRRTGLEHGGLQKPRTSAESLVNAYRKETQRRKLLGRKAKICEARLLFIVAAFTKLLQKDNHFTKLLKSESLATMPAYLGEKVSSKRKESV